MTPPERSTAGPSPRARGQRGGLAPVLPRPRSIPACAGATLSFFAIAAPVPVHPRVRGGNFVHQLRANLVDGPSPRARGQLRVGAQPTRTPPSVHPRVRGGNAGILRAASRYCGPSPRARGQLAYQTPAYSYQRSIPACAGATTVLRTTARSIAVHPRVRGGNTAFPDSAGHTNGPSPRARGQPKSQRPGAPAYRSIPACAGATKNGRTPSRSQPVHPRVRGGNAGFMVEKALETGPSPRARGQRARSAWARYVLRSIPACAGATPCIVFSLTFRPVHPRVRGGNFRRQQDGFFEAGPSPRARGQLGHALPGLGVERSIPACAGATRRHD